MDIIPIKKPIVCPSYFHRLTCTECGINVHLGCHYDTGGNKAEYLEKFKIYQENMNNSINANITENSNSNVNK